MAKITAKTGRAGASASFTFTYDTTVTRDRQNNSFHARVSCASGNLFELTFGPISYDAGAGTRRYALIKNGVTLEYRDIGVSDEWALSGSETFSFTSDEWVEFDDTNINGTTAEWWDEVKTISPTPSGAGFVGVGADLKTSKAFLDDTLRTMTFPLKWNGPYVEMQAQAGSSRGPSSACSISCEVSGLPVPDPTPQSGSYTYHDIFLLIDRYTLTWHAEPTECIAHVDVTDPYSASVTAYANWCPTATIAIDGQFMQVDEEFSSASPFYLDNYLEAHRYCNPYSLTLNPANTWFDIVQDRGGIPYAVLSRESCTGSYSKTVKQEMYHIGAWGPLTTITPGHPYMAAKYTRQTLELPANVAAGPKYDVWKLKRKSSFSVEDGSHATRWEGLQEYISGAFRPAPTVTDMGTFLRFTSDSTYAGYGARKKLNASADMPGDVPVAAWRYMTIRYRSHGSSDVSFDLRLPGQVDTRTNKNHQLRWALTTGADDEWKTVTIDLKHPETISRYTSGAAFDYTEELVLAEGEHKSDSDYSASQETVYRFGFNDLFGPVNWDDWPRFHLPANVTIDIDDITLISESGTSLHTLTGHIALFADERLMDEFAAGSTLRATDTALAASTTTDYEAISEGAAPWNLDGYLSWLGGWYGFVFDGSDWQSYIDKSDDGSLLTHVAQANVSRIVGIRPGMAGPAESGGGGTTQFRFRASYGRRLYGHVWNQEKVLSGVEVRFFYPIPSYTSWQNYPDHPAKTALTDTRGYWTMKPPLLIKKDLNNILRLEGSAGGYALEVFTRDGNALSPRVYDYAAEKNKPQHFGFWTQIAIEESGLSYDVSRAGIHARAFVRNGTIHVGTNRNAIATDWKDIDTGITGSHPCVRFDRTTKSDRLWLVCTNPPSLHTPVKARYTLDYGNTWSSAMTITNDGDYSALCITDAGLQFFYWINFGLLYGRVFDAFGNQISPATVLIEGVDESDIAAKDFTLANGNWYMKLTYRMGGQIIDAISTDGITFS